MQVGAFELMEPVPELRRPHLFIALKPWIDVGSVGTKALTTLEKALASQELGRLRRPSTFYDFTRYRPLLQRVDGERHVDLPNTVLQYAKGQGSHDFVFLHALEPHANAEEFLESVLEVISVLGVARYCQVGAMYGSSPHTRPLTMTGNATEEAVQEKLAGLLKIRTSTYEGPTSLMALATQRLQERDIDTLGMLVQLPPYVQLEEDRTGQLTLLRALDTLYEFQLDLSRLERQGARQYREIDRAVQADSQVRAMVRRLEQAHDSSATETQESPGPAAPLSPEVERFLDDLERQDRSE